MLIKTQFFIHSIMKNKQISVCSNTARLNGLSLRNLLQYSYVSFKENGDFLLGLVFVVARNFCVGIALCALFEGCSTFGCKVIFV